MTIMANTKKNYKKFFKNKKIYEKAKLTFLKNYYTHLKKRKFEKKK